MTSLIIHISYLANLDISVWPYHTYKDYEIDYSNGSGGINLDSSLFYHGPSYLPPSYGYTRRFHVNTFSGGEVEHLGLTHIEYEFFINDQQISVQRQSWNDSVLDFSEGSFIHLNGLDNITYTGFVKVKFNVEDIIQNETIYFQISSLVSRATAQIHQTIFGRYLLEVLDVIAIIVLVYVIYRIIKRGGRPLQITEEMAKKDIKYFDFLRRYQKDENQPSKKQE